MEHLREACSPYAGWVDAIPLVVTDMTQSPKKNKFLFNDQYFYNLTLSSTITTHLKDL
jgi:hypothetical protein